MRKIEPELITGMGYIGDNPGVLYNMSPAGAVKEVRGGASVLLEGAADAKLKYLTLHGKSTQGSTTGAQLFDKSKAFAGWVKSDGSINNAGTVGKEDNIVSEYIPFEAGKQYFCGSDFVWIYNTEKGFVKKADTELKGGVFTSPDNAGFFVVAFSVSAEKALAKSNEIMINVGSVKKPYEPYTGGAPSPSPSYPQEIESAGRSGEIGVDVCGGNLFDKNQIILGYEHDTDGKILKHPNRACVKRIPVAKGMYTISNTSGFAIIVVSFDNDGNMLKRQPSIAASFETPENTAYIGVTFYEGVTNITELDGVMLNLGSTALPYEPYKPAQTLIIPTPGGLPGIPVSSGGNYTDEKGQQWVADEIDLAKGERVQRIENIDLKKRSWIKQSRHKDIGGFYFYSKIERPTLFGTTIKGTASNIGSNKNPYNMIGDYVWALTNGGSSEFRIGFADSTIDSLEKLTNLLNSLPEAYAMYCLAEPIRTPLPPETIAAYKSLKTYSPTTTVINDAGAGMSVGYRRK